MGIPDSIEALAEKNYELLRSISFNPDIDDPLSLCTPDAYRSTHLFTEEMISYMFSGARDNSQMERAHVAADEGMLLVRPDMMHAKNQFEDFISERFEAVESITVIMDSFTYWNIYKHDFYRLETMHCRLTRAAVYIGSACQLITFRSSQEELERRGVPTADYVHSQLKGSQGVYQEDTLRGDIVFRNAVRLGLHQLPKERNSLLETATDPFRAYQKLVEVNPERFERLTYPILFFVGVGVHVPDATEIATDLPAVKKLT